MLVREWAHLLAIDENGADDLVILQHRHQKKGPSAGRFSDSDRTRSAGEITLIQPNVSDMDHLPRCDETKQSALLGGWITGSRRRNSAYAGGALCSATVRNVSPPRKNIVPNLASQMRTAFSSMALNTGSSWPGERLMTCSTSEVAVCCSRASFSSRVSAAT